MLMTVISCGAVVLLSCAVLGACANADAADVTAEGPLLLSSGNSDEGMAAEVQGTVTLNYGCLAVDGDPAIWPEGTTWDSKRQVLTLPDGAEVALGDEVAGGGGYYSQQSKPVDDYPTEVAELLRSCLGPSDEVAMFNRGHSIEKSS